jgi:hypothetical protein
LPTVAVSTAKFALNLSVTKEEKKKIREKEKTGEERIMWASI